MDADEQVRLANYCFGCGQMNPAGLKLDVSVTDGRARAVYHPRPEHQGFPGMMHGGLVATLLDEVMGWAIVDAQIWATTGKMEIRFRRPVPLDQDLAVEATITKRRGRALVTRGEVRTVSSNELLVESEALFVRVRPDRHKQLGSIYRPENRLAR